MKKNHDTETYAAVVGSSLDNLTKDGIGLTLGVSVLGLELATAVLGVVGLLVVEEAHVVLMSDPGYQVKMAREDEDCLEGRRYALYAEIVGPTDIGRHRPRNDVEVAHGAPARVVSPGT